MHTKYWKWNEQVVSAIFDMQDIENHTPNIDNLIMHWQPDYAGRSKVNKQTSYREENNTAAIHNLRLEN